MSSGGVAIELTRSGGGPGPAMDAGLAGLGPLTPGPSPPAKPGGRGARFEKGASNITGR